MKVRELRELLYEQDDDAEVLLSSYSVAHGRTSLSTLTVDTIEAHKDGLGYVYPATEGRPANLTAVVIEKSFNPIRSK